ncbi:nephrocystin-3-like, partial [Stylophora pistillata]|uniref:nephrocystin-3-like n=1 Tax=Stylophora pistillata TaxID=50429 RepID=UPI000C04DE26
MLPDDASYLLRLLSGVTDSEVEKEIARALDYQPLALASAAIYVKQVRESKIASKFGWTDFLKKLEKGQRGTIEDILAETNPSYPKTMTTVTTLALEKVMKSDRVLDHLFIFLSLCAPHPILKDIVVDYIMEMENELEDKDAIGLKISRCPLLLFDEEESGVYIRVHGIVHYVVNSVTKRSAKDKQIKCILRAASSFSKFKDQDSLVVGTKIVPHLVKVIKDFEDFSFEERISQMAQIDNLTSQDYSNVFTALGNMCSKHSQYPAARSYFSAVLEIAELRNPSDELQKANIYNNLGVVHRKLGLVYWHLGDLKQAKGCLERALDVWLKKLGPDHVDVAACHDNLGGVYQQLGDLKGAKDCHDRALDIRMKKLGPEHVDVAMSYCNLGLLHWQLGDLNQAKDCHKRALDVSLKKLGPEHNDVAMSYHNLGLVHWQLADLKQAKDYYEKALDIWLKNPGPEHVYIANCYHNLGLVHCQLGDLKQTKDCLERALDVRVKKLAADHVDVATSYNYLGLLYWQLGDIKQAKDCNERAHNCLKMSSSEHVTVADTYINVGVLHNYQGQIQEAKECFDRALAICINTFGPEDEK